MNELCSLRISENLCAMFMSWIDKFSWLLSRVLTGMWNIPCRPTFFDWLTIKSSLLADNGINDGAIVNTTKREKSVSQGYMKNPATMNIFVHCPNVENLLKLHSIPQSYLHDEDKLRDISSWFFRAFRKIPI